MWNRRIFLLLPVVAILGVMISRFLVFAAQLPAAPPDAVLQAQQSQPVPIERPEQRKTEHDLSNIFSAQQADPSSPVFKRQPKEGKNSGFDFYRDPLNSDRPMQDPDEIMRQLAANKQKVMEAQRALLYRARGNLRNELEKVYQR